MAKRLLDALEQRATRSVTERELRHLDDHLLRDIGLRREAGRIVAIAPLVSVPSPAAVGPERAAVTGGEGMAEEHQPLGSPPLVSGG